MPTNKPPGTPMIDGLLAGHAAQIVNDACVLFEQLAGLDEQTRMQAINDIRAVLHEHSPMRHEPVDFVRWVPAEQVAGNAYNPNVVAPPEMRLLKLSITSDGFTQPIVAWPAQQQAETAQDGQDGAAQGYEVVDGFHRHRVGKEDRAVRKRLHGMLPITVINPDRTDLPDRQAATIRHNRARGQHTVEGMSEIVVDLARRGKTDQWIGRELGLDPDEVRRLRQVSGLAEAFADQEFSEAWTVDPWADDSEEIGAAPSHGDY